VKPFGTPGAFGNYYLNVQFSDGHADNLMQTLSDVSVTPPDSASMNSLVSPNGSIRFNWALPSGVSNQNYQVRIRNPEGSKEYYVSGALLDGTSATAYWGDLRNLEHCKTYKWFLRTTHPSNSARWDTERKDFFYNPFGLNFHTFTAAKAGSGTGTVTSLPAGINCGSYCSDTFVAGLPVTLTATPNSGSIFAGWSGVPLRFGIRHEGGTGA
jgi:hypothetical protein